VGAPSPSNPPPVASGSVGSGTDAAVAEAAVPDPEAAEREAVLKSYRTDPVYDGGHLFAGVPIAIPPSHDCYPHVGFCSLEPMNPPSGLREPGFDDCSTVVSFVGQPRLDGPIWFWELPLDRLGKAGELSPFHDDWTRARRAKDPHACCYLFEQCK
jgi:hypothetical protein